MSPSITNAAVVGWLLAGVGACLLVAVGWLLLQARRSVAWPSTTGRVVEAKREETASGSRDHGGRWRLALTYEYTVNGQRHEGHRVAFGDRIFPGRSRQAEVDELVARYPRGQEVTVHYDPRDPSRCALQTGTASNPYHMLLVVAGLLFVGGIAVVQGWVHVAG